MLDLSAYYSIHELKSEEKSGIMSSWLIAKTFWKKTKSHTDFKKVFHSKNVLSWLITEKFRKKTKIPTYFKTELNFLNAKRKEQRIVLSWIIVQKLWNKSKSQACFEPKKNWILTTPEEKSVLSWLRRLLRREERNNVLS